MVVGRNSEIDPFPAWGHHPRGRPSEETLVAKAANHSIPQRGRFRRALGATWAYMQAMESTSFEYTLDRIESLEREVGRLREELRQSRAPAASDASN